MIIQSSVLFQGHSPEFPGSDFWGGAPKSGLNFSNQTCENLRFLILCHYFTMLIQFLLRKRRKPNPPSEWSLNGNKFDEYAWSQTRDFVEGDFPFFAI